MRQQSQLSPPRMVNRPWLRLMAICKPTTVINSDRRPAFYPKPSSPFRSAGGSVVAGIQIGESIRLKGFTTVVAGTARCASACAIACLGGTPRLMSPQARVGFHAAYSSETGQETGVGNGLVGAYLDKIGLPYSAVIYITQAAPNSMTWLSIADAEKQGIDVELLGSGPVDAPDAKEACSLLLRIAKRLDARLLQQLTWATSSLMMSHSPCSTSPKGIYH